MNKEDGYDVKSFHATTIFAVQHNGKCAMAGDGQVTFGNAVVMKHTAKKVRRFIKEKCLQDLLDLLQMPLHCLKSLNRG